MESGYRRGLLIVVLAIVVSGGLSMAWMIASSRDAATAAQDLGPGSVPIGSFSLVERSGRAVTEEALRDRAWIASFIFTRCKLSCPRITSIMKSLQDRLEGTDVQLVSISVDPEYDTPEVLAQYARSFGADPSRWWFLTGDRDAILAMIHDKFLLPAMANPSPATDGSDEAVVHSDRLALVDHGKVVGLFDTHDPKQVEAIAAKASRSALPGWVRTLPAINATLNGLCTILLIAGWLAIYQPTRPSAVAEAEASAQPSTDIVSRMAALLRNPAVRGHLLAMALALLTSAVFLGSYLLYHHHAGSRPFPGRGPLKWAYLTILTSHSFLAVAFVVPLVLLTVLRAVRGDFARHVRVARVAFPIWLYVSITGVVVYLMLYQLPVLPPAVTLP